MKNNQNREIVWLSQEAHILKRPEMYISSVKPTEEKIPIIENKKLVSKNMIISIGMHKLFSEILDNSFDELKHLSQLKEPFRGKILVDINTKENKITIIDNGRGFYKGLDINKNTGYNNIVTAFSELRAGSNFENDDEIATIVGTNGVGASIVNVLSDEFSIETSDGKYKYSHTWNKFKTTKSNTEQGLFKSGTLVSFIPRKEIFGQKWNIEWIISNMMFRNFIKNSDEYLKNVQLVLRIDDQIHNIDTDFFPSNMIELKNTKHLRILTWPSYSESVSVSFVNGTLCSGIHQRMINEIIDTRVYDYDKAHNLYETCVILNLPPKHVKFGDQNKTKFVSTRSELEPILKFNITEKELVWIKESEWFGTISKNIDDVLKRGELNKLKKVRKQHSFKISPKFFPSTKKENLYLVEGNSARGSLIQKRNPTSDAVYTLRGKVQNARNLEDLSSNKEIIDMINILDLNLDDRGDKIKYKRIIISTDADCLEENTQIVTETGIKYIKDVTYDDKILTHNNEYRKINNIIQTTKDEYIEIQILGKKIKCTERHKFLVYRDGEVQEIMAKDLLKTDMFLIKKIK